MISRVQAYRDPPKQVTAGEIAAEEKQAKFLDASEFFLIYICTEPLRGEFVRAADTQMFNSVMSGNSGIEESAIGRERPTSERKCDP